MNFHCKIKYLSNNLERNSLELEKELLFIMIIMRKAQIMVIRETLEVYSIQDEKTQKYKYEIIFNQNKI